ncbi:lamin tail domain-containing protein [Candidatus Woesearchaeota archaeon]|nr:lamin tail domain-containing protein [Candidatus Woesearchaeota archaeon]
MKQKIALFIFLFSVSAYANTYINEINYDPAGSDNNFEYIEIYSDEILNNITLKDLKSKDELELVKRYDGNYYLVVEEGFNYSSLDCNIFSAGATIGNNLNNDRDSLVLEYNNTILDAVSYSEKYGGNGNGKVLCKIPNLIGVMKECIPTVCNENSNNINYNIIINEIMPDPIGNDDAEMPNGEWIEVYNNENYNLSLGGFYFEDLANHKLYISETNTKNPNLGPREYGVIYANGFNGLLNNEDFEEIKLFGNEGNLIDKISYGFSREGVSWAKIKDKWVLSLPTAGKENPEKEDDIDLNSKISIEKIYLGSDEKAKFGDNIRFKINVYKGDTGKESVQAWIEKGKEIVTKRARINVEEKFFEYPVTLSLQIDPNCKKKYNDGEYKLVVQGLDSEDNEDIEISGINNNLCEQPKTKEAVLVSNKDLKQEVVEEVGYTETNLNSELTNEITGSIIYSSSTEKQRNLVMYLFSFLMLILLMYVLLRKND